MNHRRLPRRPLGNATLDYAERGAAIGHAEGERRIGVRDQPEGFLVVGIDHAALRCLEEISEQLAQLVHALVVERDVQEDAHRRLVLRDRTVALVQLGHVKVGVTDHRAGEGAVLGDEVLHHRAVHDRRIAACVVQYPAEHPGHGRLAAGTRDGDARFGSVEQRRV